MKAIKFEEMFYNLIMKRNFNNENWIYLVKYNKQTIILIEDDFNINIDKIMSIDRVIINKHIVNEKYLLKCKLEDKLEDKLTIKNKERIIKI